MLEISLKFLGFGTNTDQESCPDKQNRMGTSLIGPQNRMLHPHNLPERPTLPAPVSGTHRARRAMLGPRSVSAASLTWPESLSSSVADAMCAPEQMGPDSSSV